MAFQWARPHHTCVYCLGQLNDIAIGFAITGNEYRNYNNEGSLFEIPNGTELDFTLILDWANLTAMVSQARYRIIFHLKVFLTSLTKGKVSNLMNWITTVVQRALNVWQYTCNILFESLAYFALLCLEIYIIIWLRNKLILYACSIHNYHPM